MTLNKKIWLEGMYTMGKEHGHDIISEKPEISLVALESEIFNYIVQSDSYRKYSVVAEKQAKRAAQRVWRVVHDVEE